MQLEVLEDEVYRLASMAGALAAAMPLGNNQVNLDSAPGAARTVEDQVRMTLPYLSDAFDGKTPIEKEREAAVEQYKDMHRRMMKDAVDTAPATPVVIKPVKGRHHA